MARHKASFKQDRATQAGLLVAAATLPNTFQETLMPRSTVDQGLVTGLNMSLNYEIANTIVKFIEDLAEQLSGTHTKNTEDYAAQVRQRRFSIALSILALVGSSVTEKRLEQQPNESPIRGIARTSAAWTGRAAFANVIVSVLQSLLETNDRQPKRKRVISQIPVGLIGGLFAAIYSDHKRRNAVKASNGQKLHDNHTNNIEALGMGFGVLGLLAGVGYGQKAFADLVSEQMKKILPDSEDFWWSAGHATAIVGTGLAIALLMRRTYHRIEEVATEIEPAYLTPPHSALVSGSRASLVTWKSLSVQGRRYTAGVLSKEDINAVMKIKNAHDPIRVFVGLDSAKNEKARVKLAIDELERTGAFSRDTIMLISPTGTGYVNYVAVEAAEYMSKGNIASVALQYSKRPSPMSLDRVPEGRGQFKMILKEISRRIDKIPKSKRPRLVIFGESLGAWTSQDCFINQGTDGLVYSGVDRALWIGSPYGSKWKTQVLHEDRPDVDKSLVGSFDNIKDLQSLPKTKQNKLRYVMITHHNDGVALFGASLLYQKPDWLSEPAKRPPTVSKSQYYTSPGTFLLTLMDMKNSMNVIPGQFEASGHDYRADLAEFISQVYEYTITKQQMTAVEKALRQNEIIRADKLSVKK